MVPPISDGHGGANVGGRKRCFRSDREYIGVLEDIPKH